ncbi:MAG: hypothetical protein GEU86_01305 [Actinophytocola sp.]|nr:hypothetical protein [Actinophytocola sp.]
MTAARDELKRELGDIGAIETLTDDQAVALLTAFNGARRRQAAILTAARDEALRHVPRLLRGSVRRVLGA